MFYEELRNRELDEKRQRKALINYTHMVSRNTSQEEIACSSLKSSSSFWMGMFEDGGDGTREENVTTKNKHWERQTNAYLSVPENL